MAKRTIKQNFFDAAVINLVGDCVFDTDGKTILVWKSPDKTQPSQSAIEAKMVELQEEWDSQAYARKRAQEYPELAEQLDLLWHAIDAGTLDDRDHRNKFYSMLKKVKMDNPKG